LLSARETVDIATPAAAATSASVGRRGLVPFRSDMLAAKHDLAKIGK
jgi:hypothetical protein